MSTQFLNCIICQEKAKLICFCSNISLCEKCIGKHLLNNPSINHKPVPLSDSYLSSKYTQNLEDLNKTEEKILQVAACQQEVINAIQSKLANEILELEEFKKLSLEVIAEFIKGIQRDVIDASKIINNFVTEQCDNAQKELRNALVLLKLSHDANHPILSLLLRCKSVEEVRNIEIAKKDLTFKDLKIKETIKDGIYFCFDIVKDNNIPANKFPQLHPGVSSNKLESIRRVKVGIPGMGHGKSAEMEKEEVEEIMTPHRIERTFSENSPERTPTPIVEEVFARKTFNVLPRCNEDVKIEKLDFYDTPLMTRHIRDTPISHSRTLPPDKGIFQEALSLEVPPRLINESFRSAKNIELGLIKGRQSIEPRTQQLSPQKNQRQRQFDPLPPSLYCFIPESSKLIIYNTSTKHPELIDFESEAFYSKSAWGVSEDGKLILTGGYDGSSRKQTFMYNLYEKCIEKAPNMILSRYNHAQVALGHYIYVIGGFNTSPLKECEKLNLFTKKWQKTGNLIIARDCHAACVHSGRIFVAGGTGIDSIEVFNAVSEKFSLIRVRLPVPGRCCMFPHNKNILLFQRNKAISFSPTTMSCTEISAIEEAEWWTPGDPVITSDFVYFITHFNAFKFQVETGTIGLEFSFNLEFY
ncbi:unnamed protein product [Blepharisma stoltei]|uniref:B box-type domain-containing protein n=1 Tax=Blepharisma stoltei TaxID=1481888 RepID=A0AAU9IHG3_9CILI|nr:unnamed protein product [Blepharisma stoltei]